MHQVAGNYTLADAVSTTFPDNVDIVRGEPETCLRLARGIGGGGAALASATIGQPVVSHRTSWVRLVNSDSNVYFIKTYIYPSPLARLRAWRWAGPGRATRPAREFDALTWMRQQGFPAPRPVAALERRVAGFVRCAVLITEPWPGTDLATLLPTLPKADRTQLRHDLCAAIGALHDAGYRDGNLDLRNLLARRIADRWEIAKIDSPKFRIVAPGRGMDRRRRADWDRLEPQLAAFGMTTDPDHA